MKGRKEINEFNFFSYLSLLFFPLLLLPLPSLCRASELLSNSIRNDKFIFCYASQHKCAQRLICMYVYVRVPHRHKKTGLL